MSRPGTDPAGPPLLRLGGQPLPLLTSARVYTCGITPYDVTHLGHAAVFVWVDLLTRLLRHDGRSVTTCRNITDVDDVLVHAAARAAQPYDAFAAVQQFSFDRDMAALGVRPPTHEPRAHRYVPTVLALAAALLDTGRAYRAGGSVLLDASATPARAGLDDTAALAAAHAAGHVAVPGARHPLDPAVWLGADADSATGPAPGGSGPGAPAFPAWPSPFGPGRPGWHATCAAMALDVLGPGIDVHAGGADLAYPHHACEAAMAEGATGVAPFARSWLHVGTVGVHGAKMAKSTGNLVLVADLLADTEAAAVRLLLLDRPVRAGWDYSPAALGAAAERLDRLRVAAGRPAGATADAADPAPAAVLAALHDDLDVPTALAVAEDAGGAAARLALSLLT